MTTLHLVDLERCASQPWRNGGGRTRALLAWPQTDDWRLRISVATIATSGPFSPYPGMQRWFAVLDGAGVRLALPDGEATLTPQDAPIAFEGEAAPMCHLLDGPTHDLNFIARRGEGLATMRLASPGGRLEGDHRFRALYTAAHALLDVDDRTEPLGAGTLVWSDERDAAAWALREGPHAFWLTLEDA